MRTLLLALAALIATPASAQGWTGKEQDITLRDFHFADGESLPQLNMHVTTLGEPHRNAAGEIDNEVMILHGPAARGINSSAPNLPMNCSSRASRSISPNIMSSCPIALATEDLPSLLTG